MIVECSHCNTKFNLPDDKIKPGGVKIRCTRCKNVFEVSPPEQSAPLEDSFSADLDDDLSGFDEGKDDFGSGEIPDSGGEGGIDQDLGGGDFNVDAGDSDFDLDSDLDSDLGSDLDSDLDLGSQDQKTEDSDSLEFEMDTEGESTPDIEKPPAPSGGTDAKAEGESDFNLENDLEDNLGDLDLSFDEAPAPAGGETPSDAGSDFDLSFDDKPESADISAGPIPVGQPPSDVGMTDSFGMDDDSLLGGKDDLGFDDSLGIGAGDEPFDDLEGPAPIEKGKKTGGRRSPLTVALLILLVLVAGGYWAYSTYFSEGFDPDKLLSTFSGNEDPLANLENAEMKMHYYYVMNEQAGKILVLEGIVINHSEYGKGRIKVKATLYDKSGNELGKSESFCGNILSLKELESLPKAEIAKLLSVEAGKKFDNAHIKTNESIPYMLVVFSVPEGTDGFVVDVVGAQNVGK